MNPHQIRAFAPGRVNLIGEHTDYNEGLCLPFATERGVTVTATLHDGDGVTSPDLPEDDPFLRGTVAELRREGIEVTGCAVTVESDLPRATGLASSAALCVALSLALCGVSRAEPPPPAELARICSRVENDWAGAETGLLDQLASLLGTEGHAVLLDMRSLKARPVPLDLDWHTLAVIDSGAKRILAASGYNERREECRRAAKELGLESLRDANVPGDELSRDAHTPGSGSSRNVHVRDLTALSAPLDRRVRHVVTENARVEAAVSALRDGDLEALGALLDASHASLRDDYEVSVPEVEAAVAACKDSGALGARIMGGGFGGSVLALFPPGAEPPQGALRVSPGPGAAVC